MKRILLAIFLITIFALSEADAQSSIKLPQFKKVKLSNGMTVLLMEQHEVPFVSFSLVMRAGGTADPAGKEGLASLTAGLLRKGTKKRTADQISTELDFVGATLGFGASEDYSNGFSEVLKKDVAVGLDLLSDVLINPTFPESEFTKLRQQRIDSAKQAKDFAQAVISEYYNAFLFGNHPYARPVSGDEKTLAAITRDDVVKFYDNHYAPNNLILAVVGDFSTAEMEKLLNERFGGWTKQPANTTVKLSDPQPVKGRRLLFVNKPDATQTFFVIGNVGISRTNPDRVGIAIINTLFGGRFTSMLNTDLRINSGLTYGANSSFDQMVVPGPFAISTYTKNESTEKAVDMALDILKRLHEKGITEEQLKSAKQYIKGQFATTVETSGQLASRIALLEFYGLDEREVNDYFAKIDAFKLEDAQRIIKQYFPLDNLVFVMIGKVDEVGTVVKKYAPNMEVKQISQPGYR